MDFDRDLGTFLKTSIRKKEGKLEENQEFWDRQYLSIQRIINNDHFNKYPRALSSSATGLTPEQCNLILSNEFLKQLQEEEQSLFRKLFSFKTDSVKNEPSKDNI